MCLMQFSCIDIDYAMAVAVCQFSPYEDLMDSQRRKNQGRSVPQRARGQVETKVHWWGESTKAVPARR